MRRNFGTAGLALLAWAGTLAALPPAIPAVAGDWATVIMYHRFGEAEYPSTNINLEQFEAHIREIQRGGYTVLPLERIITALKAGRDLPDPTLGLSADDGYLSIYSEAWPRLKAAGLPLTVFVSTDSIGRGLTNMMTWDQIRELVADGVTIGAHSRSHPHMPSLSAERIGAEIADSNARFRAELGFVPKLFAYPYGEYSLEIERLVRAAGYIAAFGQQSGVVHGDEDFFALPRFAMNETYGSIGRFRLAARALPLRVTEVTPRDPVLRQVNPPPFGFTVAEKLKNLRQLACFASNQSGPARIERLGEARFEVRLEQPFKPGRGRINCTMPGPEGRWRWYGTQFYIPKD